MRTARNGTVQVHVDAPAQRVWALLSNLERMGEWSPECYRVAWEGGASSPAVPGARFRGWNRYGRLKWSTACQVKTAVPDKELSWSTLTRGKEMVTWSFRIEPSDGGVDLVESFEVRWLPLSARLAEDYLMADRDRRREQAMRQTLERIKTLAEAEARADAGSS
jgi:uncharacterized protein YndB with AHSA1/START domain